MTLGPPKIGGSELLLQLEWIEGVNRRCVPNRPPGAAPFST